MLDKLANLDRACKKSGKAEEALDLFAASTARGFRAYAKTGIAEETPLRYGAYKRALPYLETYDRLRKRYGDIRMVFPATPEEEQKIRDFITTKSEVRG
jgi:hypothetical protein